jgi:PAS domain S-box-containing protein
METKTRQFDSLEVLGALTFGIVVADRSGAILYVNEVGSKLLGRDAGQLVGRDLIELVPERYRDSHRRGFRRWAESGVLSLVGRALTYPAVLPDGSEIILSVILSAYRGDESLVVASLRPGEQATDVASPAADDWERHAHLAATVGAACTGVGSIPLRLRQCASAIVDHFGASMARIWTFDGPDGKPQLQAVASREGDSAFSSFHLSEAQILEIGAGTRVHVITPSRVDGSGSQTVGGFPLVFANRCLGVLVVYSNLGMTPAELAILNLTADMIALTIRPTTPPADPNGSFEREHQARLALDRENQLIETIYRVGLTLAGRLDLDSIVQSVTDMVTGLTGASFGAFFYNVTDERGESYLLFTLSGATMEQFSNFPLPRNTAVFDVTFRGEGVVRLADVTADPRYGQNPPFNGMPEGHLPVRSYLAVPVVGRSGEVFGGLFLGHPEVGVFLEGDERLVSGIAGQAAVAIENARLYHKAQQEAESRRRAYEELQRFADVLQQSLLPPTLPEIPGLEAAAHYEAGAQEVGGDFYDLFPLRGRSWGVMIGDVCGQGARAAALTSLARHTVRTAAMMQSRPSQVLRVLNEVLFGREGEDQLCTCIFGRLQVHSAGASFTYASGGHPPPAVVRRNGQIDTPATEGIILGAFEDPQLKDRRVELAQGDTLVVYTDGISESRRGGVQFGESGILEFLADHLSRGVGELAEGLALTAQGFNQAEHIDDMATLVIRVISDGTPKLARPGAAPASATTRVAGMAVASGDDSVEVSYSLSLPSKVESPGTCRRWVSRLLAENDLPELVDSATLLLSELVTNAVLYAGQGLIRVDVGLKGRGLRVQVHDGGSSVPKMGHHAIDAEGGRGLLLVDAIAREWGTERRPDGKVVWFTLNTDRPGI